MLEQSKTWSDTTTVQEMLAATHTSGSDILKADAPLLPSTTAVNLPSNLWTKGLVAIEPRIQCVLHSSKEAVGEVGMAYHHGQAFLREGWRCC